MLPPLANPFKKVLHPFRHTKTEPESPTAKAGGSWTRKRLRSFSGRSFEGKRAGEKGEAASQEDGNGELRVGSPGIGSGDGSEGRHEERFKVHHRYLPILSGIICPFSVLLEVSSGNPKARPWKGGIEKGELMVVLQVPGLTERVRCLPRGNEPANLSVPVISGTFEPSALTSSRLRRTPPVRCSRRVRRIALI